jgi:hypothetical protein
VPDTNGAALKQSLANLDANFKINEAATFATAASDLAACAPTPWSRYDAAVYAAKSTSTITVSNETRTRIIKQATDHAATENNQANSDSQKKTNAANNNGAWQKASALLNYGLVSMNTAGIRVQGQVGIYKNDNPFAPIAFDFTGEYTTELTPGGSYKFEILTIDKALDLVRWSPDWESMTYYGSHHWIEPLLNYNNLWKHPDSPIELEKAKPPRENKYKDLVENADRIEYDYEGMSYRYGLDNGTLWDGKTPEAIQESLKKGTVSTWDIPGQVLTSQAAVVEIVWVISSNAAEFISKYVSFSLAPVPSRAKELFADSVDVLNSVPTISDGYTTNKELSAYGPNSNSGSAGFSVEIAQSTLPIQAAAESIGTVLARVENADELTEDQRTILEALKQIGNAPAGIFADLVSKSMIKGKLPTAAELANAGLSDVINELSLIGGISQGILYDGLWGLISGAFQLGWGAGKLAVSMQQYNFYILTGQTEQARQTTYGQFLLSMAKFAQKAINGGPTLRALYADFVVPNGMLNGLEPATIIYLVKVKPDIEKIVAELIRTGQGMSQEDRYWLTGRIIGAVVFEVAGVVLTSGVTTLAKSGKLIKISKFLDGFGISPASKEKIIESLVKMLDKLEEIDAPSRGFGSSGAGLFWKEIDAVFDPTIVKQLHPDACGPASAATLLRGAGVDVGVSNVALAQKSVLSWGPELLVRAMNKLDEAGGWITKRLRNTRTAFDEITKNGPSGVTLFKFGMRVEHMVVVNGVDDLGRVIIRDPGNGMKYFMSWDEFQDLWTGTAIYR